MRNQEHIRLKQMLEEEFEINFDKERDKLLNDAKKQFLQCQEENRRAYNLRKRPHRKYTINYTVVMKRTQQKAALKSKT